MTQLDTFLRYLVRDSILIYFRIDPSPTPYKSLHSMGKRPNTEISGPLRHPTLFPRFNTLTSIQ